MTMNSISIHTGGQEVPRPPPSPSSTSMSESPLRNKNNNKSMLGSGSSPLPPRPHTLLSPARYQISSPKMTREEWSHQTRGEGSVSSPKGGRRSSWGHSGAAPPLPFATSSSPSSSDQEDESSPASSFAPRGSSNNCVKLVNKALRVVSASEQEESSSSHHEEHNDNDDSGDDFSSEEFTVPLAPPAESKGDAAAVPGSPQKIIKKRRKQDGFGKPTTSFYTEKDIEMKTKEQRQQQGESSTKAATTNLGYEDPDTTAASLGYEDPDAAAMSRKKTYSSDPCLSRRRGPAKRRGSVTKFSLEAATRTEMEDKAAEIAQGFRQRGLIRRSAGGIPPTMVQAANDAIPLLPARQLSPGCFPERQRIRKALHNSKVDEAEQLNYGYGLSPRQGRKPRSSFPSALRPANTNTPRRHSSLQGVPPAPMSFDSAVEEAQRYGYGDAEESQPSASMPSSISSPVMTSKDLGYEDPDAAMARPQHAGRRRRGAARRRGSVTKFSLEASAKVQMEQQQQMQSMFDARTLSSSPLANVPMRAQASEPMLRSSRKSNRSTLPSRADREESFGSMLVNEMAIKCNVSGDLSSMANATFASAGASTPKRNGGQRPSLTMTPKTATPRSAWRQNSCSGDLLEEMRRSAESKRTDLHTFSPTKSPYFRSDSSSSKSTSSTSSSSSGAQSTPVASPFTATPSTKRVTLGDAFKKFENAAPFSKSDDDNTFSGGLSLSTMQTDGK